MKFDLLNNMNFFEYKLIMNVKKIHVRSINKVEDIISRT